MGNANSDAFSPFSQMLDVLEGSRKFLDSDDRRWMKDDESDYTSGLLRAPQEPVLPRLIAESQGFFSDQLHGNGDYLWRVAELLNLNQLSTPWNSETPWKPL